MTRVLLAGKGPPDSGGISAFLTMLYSSDLLTDHDVVLLNLTRDEVPDAHRFTASNVERTLTDAASLWRAAQGRDLVHLHSSLAPTVTMLRAGLLALVARARGCRMVVHAHSGMVGSLFRSPWRRLLARVVLAGADHVVTVADIGRAAMARTLGQERVILIDNGVDPAGFGPAARPNDLPRIVYAGLLTPRKGVVDLLHASELLRGRGIDHELVLAGGTPDEGPEPERLVRDAAGPEAQFLGSLPHAAMAEIYRSADVFCLPSWWEAMPLSVLEAMASGLPVVATDVGDVSRAVEDGITGLLVPPKDPEALAAALQVLLTDPARRTSMGAIGRRRVEKHFDSAQTIAEVGRLYQRIHTEPRRWGRRVRMATSTGSAPRQ